MLNHITPKKQNMYMMTKFAFQMQNAHIIIVVIFLKKPQKKN